MPIIPYKLIGYNLSSYQSPTAGACLLVTVYIVCHTEKALWAYKRSCKLGVNTVMLKVSGQGDIHT